MWRIFDLLKQKKTLPWEGRPTIYGAVQRWDGRADLPDEDPQQGKIRFAAGAHDNVGLRHFSVAEAQSSRLFRAVERAVTQRREVDRVTLYRLLMQHSAVENADALASRVESSSLDREAVADIARWLAAEAPDREPVKFGLVLLAMYGSPRDVDLVTAFARHDEFTMYAASAIERLAEDPLTAELAMAEQVRGWGKIALVERIAAQGSDRADVRDWLLCRGCENAIMDEYLGFICATAGRLHEALAADSIDEELRAGACTIVRALLTGGPAEDLDDYDDGPVAVEHLLRHLEGTTRPEELAVVAHIASWLSDDRDWSRAEARGWTADVRARSNAKARSILRGEDVANRLRSAFLSDDQSARFSAWSASREAGVDLWEDAFELARREPPTSYLYQWLAHTSDPMRLRRTIALAEQHLPLERIATGPANEWGLGEAFELHSCLDSVLQELPGSGQFSARLVVAALRSPVTRNRNFARRILASTPRGEWGREVSETLTRAAAEEPDTELKGELKELLSRR